MDYVIKDKRFDHVQKDPRFRKMPVGQRKVKIDKRFKGMFKDKRFKLKYSVDKRGKPMNHTTNENLKKFYELSDQDDSDSDTEAMSRQVVNDSENSDNESAMTAVKEKQIKKKTKKKKHPQTTDKRFQISNIETDSEESDQEIELPEIGNKKNLNKSSTKKNKNKSAVKTQGKKNKKASEVEAESNDEESGNEDEDGPLASDDDDDDDDDNDSDTDDEETVGQKSGIDLARGEGNVVSSSSEEDDDDDADTDSNDDEDDDQQDDSKFDHGWGENDKTIISLDEATYRLAVCNMDWDRMKAKDIFVLLNSFKPSSGLIKSVKVYPSEYGKERMAEETAHGPRELKEMTIDEDGVSETVEGTSYHREKLREYQLNRLKYYYAVVECDSVQTADAIYNECDGLEYESSATKLDLRFIPDEETFNEDEVKTVCTNIPSNYKPQYFLNAALTQTKVELTWDETDHERVNLTTQHLKGEDIEEEDLKAYLASSSDEESGAPDYGALLGGKDDDDDDGSGDEDKKINKYKQLLTNIASDEKKKKRDVEMEISWEPGLREATEKIVKKKKEGKNKTVWEDYLERKKEKKRQKIEERKKKKEKKHADSGSESDSENDQDTGDGPVQTFSDDDVDEDMAAFMADESDHPPKQKKNKNKKKKKKKGETEETEESTKEKAELALLMMNEENKKHFSLRDLVTEDGKKKKKKNKKELMKKNMAAKGDDEDFKINVEDPRFSAVFDSHLYNIDPSAPEYRKTKGTEAIVSEKIKRISKKDKQKRSHPGGGDQNVKKQKLTDSQPKKDESLASLIKSVKSKTAHFHGNKSKSKR